MEEKVPENPQQASSQELSPEVNIYAKNLQSNKNKVLLYDFASTVTRIDYCFEKLQGYLYWVGLMEFFSWFVLIGLFISSMKYMVKVFAFIFHIPRGIIGLVILFYLPKTYEVIEGLGEIESNSLEEIREKISGDYIKIINSKERLLKPLLIIYFVLTMITIVVDIVMFCLITPDFGLEKVQGQFFAVLLLVNVWLIVGDFVYILFFTGFKYFFPPAHNEAAHKAVIGFFTQLKVGIATGFTNIAKKIKKSTNSNKTDARNSNVVNISQNQNDVEDKKEVSVIKGEVKEDNEIHIEVPNVNAKTQNNPS